MWKQQFAAALLALVAACVPEEVPAMAEPAKLMTWGDLSALPRPVAPQTIRWGEGVTDVVDLWLPEGTGPHPVVVMVHGGCWQKSIADKNLMDWMAEGLRQQGWAVWNIEYRGVDEAGGGYPGTFLDAGAATDAIKEHAAEYNLDLSRVTRIGHSAGGHLILWLAARARLPDDSPLRVSDPLQFQGVVVSGGLADLEASRSVTAPTCLDAIYDQLTGPASPERRDPLSDTSPVRMFPVGVPFVSVNGSEDRIAPPMLGDALTRKAEMAGDSASLVIIPATGHVELVSPGTQAFDIQSQILSDFIASRGVPQ